MTTLPIARIISELRVLSSFDQIMISDKSTLQISRSDAIELKDGLDWISGSTLEIGWHTSSKLAQRASAQLKIILEAQGDPIKFTLINAGEFQGTLHTFLTVIETESSINGAISLSPSQLRLYEPETPRWPEVRTALPETTFDIDEAGKCLALGRATASVFHCMRVLEACLRKVAADLELIEKNNPNWGVTLKEVRNKIYSLGPSDPDHGRLQDIMQHFHAIKDALRNPTMHVETIYTVDEADLILKNTENVARKVCSQANFIL